MESIIKKHKSRIEKSVFGGSEIHHLEGSLFEVKGENYLIVSGEPKTNHYLFTMHPGFLKRSKEVVFICSNDLIAFKVPLSILMKLPFSRKGNGRPKTKVDFDQKNLCWYLTFNKDESGVTKMDLESYIYELRSDSEIMISSLGIRDLLYTSKSESKEISK